MHSDVPLKAKSRHLTSLERVKPLGADYVNTVAKDSARGRRRCPPDKGGFTVLLSLIYIKGL